jgi:hypothetical protein
MSKLEHLVNAIARLNGLLDPESECYRLKNPLMLRSFALPGKHEVDLNGIRIFQSVLNGYKAAMFDIDLKASGKSRANAGPTSTLEQFLRCYEIKTPGAVDNVVSFLRRALQDQTLSKNTLMSYFTDSNEVQ